MPDLEPTAAASSCKGNRNEIRESLIFYFLVVLLSFVMGPTIVCRRIYFFSYSTMCDIYTCINLHNISISDPKHPSQVLLICIGPSSSQKGVQKK